jgi:transcriptional regulator
MVRSQTLALVVSHGPAGFASSPLPLLVETDEQGAVRALVGHFARANPQVAIAQAHPRTLIQILGPHGYIPPRWVSRPAWAPTWNYAYAAFETELEFMPNDNDRVIRDLVEEMEAGRSDAWRIEQMGERYATMLPHVIAFRAHVVSANVRFKLGQDEGPDTFAEILAGLGDTPLRTLMIEQRGIVSQN